MALGITEWTILLITIAFGILVILFTIQMIRYHKTAWSFLISLTFGFLAGLVAIINELFFSIYTNISNFFQSLHLNLYGLHFFFFYIFFEQLISKKLNSIRLSIMTGFLIIQTIGLWQVFYCRVNSLNADIAWVLADIGYWTPALFVYLGMGSVIYIKTYIYTKEKMPIILFVALVFVSFGFIISLLNDMYFILNVFTISIPKPDLINDLSNYANIFPFIGIIMFVITYLSNINYLYRLPNDNYLLMVLEKSGTPLYSVRFKTRKKINVEEVLLSGMISAINNVFKEIFKEETAISEISSKRLSILMETGEKTVALLITDKVTYFLDKALILFLKNFELKFQKEIKNDVRDLMVFEKATELLAPIFPFFIIEKVSE
ncbi:MAG: hypothetical protein ACTSXT_06720 [Candidatus Helarchaeota archaeon]